jgi:ABC-type amino acid transport system permease subunit
MIMLEEYDRRIPLGHKTLAAASQWILLAGYLIIPGTFTSLQRSSLLNDASARIVQMVKNPPLLAIACICFAFGAAVLGWLSWKWRYNYIWLSHLFRSVAYPELKVRLIIP